MVTIIKSDFSSSRWCLMFPSWMDWKVTAKPVWEERLSKYRKYLLDTSSFLIAASASVSPPNIWPVMLLGCGFVWKQLSFLFFSTLPALDFWLYISTSFIFCTKWHQFELAAAHPYTHIFPCGVGCFLHSSWWMDFISGSKEGFHLKLLSSLLGGVFAFSELAYSYSHLLSFFFWFSHQFHLTVIGLVKYLLCSTTYTLLGLFTKNLQSATCTSKIKILKTIKPRFVLSLCYFPAWPPKHIAFPYTDSWFKEKIYNFKKLHRIV